MNWEQRKKDILEFIIKINDDAWENIFNDTDHILFQWEPNNLERHLGDRKKEGHLPYNSDAENIYNIIINHILTDNPEIAIHKDVNRYQFGKRDIHNLKLPNIKHSEWIVVLNRDRYVITAFPPDNYDDYFTGDYGRLGYFEDLRIAYDEEQSATED